MAFTWLQDYQKLVAGNKQKKNGVPMPDTLFSQRYAKAGSNGNGKEMSVPGGKQMSNGFFTGMGGDGKLQPDMPVSQEKFNKHEGEFVIPAATVDELGGPENVDSVIKQLKMKSDEVNRGMAGYQAGGVVDSNTAPEPGAPTSTGVDVTKVQNTAAQFTPAAATKESLGIQDAPALKKSDIAVPESAAAQKFAGQFSGATDRLEARSKGESPEMEKLAQVSRDKMAGRQSAETGAMRQQMAQTMKGAPGGAANAMMAINKAAQAGEMTELERGIFETKVNDMNDATNQLVIASMSGMNFEENKRQFGEQMAYNIEQFNENRRRHGVDVAFRLADMAEEQRKYGIETALNIEAKDWQRNSEAIDAMVKAGDYDGANKLLTERGIPIDFSKAIEAENSKKLNDGMVNLTADINSGLPYDNATVQNNLQSMAEAQGMTWDSPEAKTWAKQTFDSMTLANSPGYQIWGPMTDNDLTAVFGPLDDFKDPVTGASGQAGARMALTRASYVPGVFGPDGQIMDPDKFAETIGWDGGSPGGGVPGVSSFDPEMDDAFGSGALSAWKPLPDGATDEQKAAYAQNKERVIEAQSSALRDATQTERLSMLKKLDKLPEGAKDEVLAYTADVTPDMNTQSNKTSNAWNDRWFFSEYGTEDSKGRITYEKGQMVKVGGYLFETTGKSEKSEKGDGMWKMEVKDLKTGKTLYLDPKMDEGKLALALKGAAFGSVVGG